MGKGMERKRDRDYEKSLNAIVDVLFTIADDEYGYSWVELAAAAKLSYSTVRNLGNRKTIYPELRTIIRLCSALGREVVVHEKAKRASLRRAA